MKLLRSLPLAVIPMVFFHFVRQEPFQLFPSSDKTVFPYSDSLMGGNTKIHTTHITDTAASILFTLEKGYAYPYAGLTVGTSSKYFPDLSKYDFIDLDIST